MPHIIFRAIHIVLQVSKCQLGLNHPELRQMPCCVAVLSPAHQAPSLSCQLLIDTPVKETMPSMPNQAKSVDKHLCSGLQGNDYSIKLHILRTANTGII